MKNIRISSIEDDINHMGKIINSIGINYYKKYQMDNKFITFLLNNNSSINKSKLRGKIDFFTVDFFLPRYHTLVDFVDDPNYWKLQEKLLYGKYFAVNEEIEHYNFITIAPVSNKIIQKNLIPLPQSEYKKYLIDIIEYSIWKNYDDFQLVVSLSDNNQ